MAKFNSFELIQFQNDKFDEEFGYASEIDTTIIPTVFAAYDSNGDGREETQLVTAAAGRPNIYSATFEGFQ